MNNEFPIEANRESADSRSRHRAAWSIAAISMLAMGGMTAVRLLDIDGWRVPLTVLASSGFVAVALIQGAARSRYGICVLVALLFCWIGDIVGPGNFLAGTWAFLLAHLALVPAFTMGGIIRRPFIAAGGLLTVAAVANLYHLLPRVPDDEMATVILYTAVISLMVMSAAGSARRQPWVLVAAMIFYVSDIFVSQWRYVGDPWYGYACYPLYYLACNMFALSVHGDAAEAGIRTGAPLNAPEATPASKH